MSQDLSNLISNSKSIDLISQSTDLRIKKNSFINHGIFSRSEISDDPNISKELFSKKRKIIDEYNNLKKMITSRDLLEYSSIGKKEITSGFIRCLDIYQNGKIKS